MFSRNQVILIVISVLTLSLSGFLFYQGFVGIKNNPEVLGENGSGVISTNINEEKSDDEISRSARNDNEEAQNNSANSVNNNKFKVSKVVDGDTIEVLVGDQKESIRFIGINTPETVDPRRPVECFGKEASNENKRLLEGKEVILEKDITERDKYQRLLRYVYLPLSDGTLLFVNDYLVRQGFASVYTYPPDVKFDK
ncbi:MAG: thermonuclease family protein, partial [Nanoarchaeota archaeon]